MIDLNFCKITFSDWKIDLEDWQWHSWLQVESIYLILWDIQYPLVLGATLNLKWWDDTLHLKYHLSLSCSDSVTAATPATQTNLIINSLSETALITLLQLLCLPSKWKKESNQKVDIKQSLLVILYNITTVL